MSIKIFSVEMVFMLFLASLVGSLQQMVNVNAASVATAITLPYKYPFAQAGTLNESASIDLSSSPYWYVNSGAYLKVTDGVGATVQGNLLATASWRILYANNNPADTDNGYHPQNIFRLLTRTKWQDVAQSNYFRVDTTNLSTSPNRNASNGLLLFSRYQDANNLYYFGLRVDGIAVIKKKKNGTYYTIVQKKVLPGTYAVNTNPNLLPAKTWIGLKAVTKNVGSQVSLTLFTDIGKTGNWTEVFSAMDDGTKYGGAAFTASGYGGMRTDFMDVSFDDYLLTSTN